MYWKSLTFNEQLVYIDQAMILKSKGFFITISDMELAEILYINSRTQPSGDRNDKTDDQNTR